MALGFVYILSNDAMPNIFKVGHTTFSVEERVQELSGVTGVPVSFVIEYWCFTYNADVIEQEAFELLSKRRVNEAREFFYGPLDEIIGTLDMLRRPVPIRFQRGQQTG